MEAHTFQRIAAYIIDVFIVSLILTLLTFWIPVSDKYTQTFENQDNLVTSNQSSEIDSIEYSSIRYTIDKETQVVTVISSILSLGYFATYAYYNNGQTLGKKLMKIRIVSNDNKELNHIRFICRSLIVNSILVSLLSTLLLCFTKPNQYMYIVGVLQSIQGLFIMVSILMVAFRSDRKGIHDLLLNTNVIQE